MRENPGAKSQIEIQVERKSLRDVAQRSLDALKSNRKDKEYIVIRTDNQTHIMVDKRTIAKRTKAITEILIGDKFCLSSKDSIQKDVFTLVGRVDGENICSKEHSMKEYKFDNNTLIFPINKHKIINYE